MRLKSSFAACLIATSALTATTGTTAYAAESCFGLTPTIVGGPGEAELTGTEGDDVIVDAHGRSISSLGGNDAICSVDSDWINAGNGDDKVNVLDAEKGNFFALGLGSDEYVGSDADERVIAGSLDSTDILEGAVGDSDTITTFGGKDRVFSLTWSYPNADVIDLGDGPDSIRLSSAPGGSFVVEAGGGRDEIELDQYGIAGNVALDLGTGSVEIGGPTTARASGFEDASSSSQEDRVTLTGTSGRNELHVNSGDGLVLGLGGSDDLSVTGCGSVARAGAGADEVEDNSYQGCAGDPVTLYGGAGNDELRGGRDRDILIGNAGRDTARGGRGQDTCRAEVERRCERD